MEQKEEIFKELINRNQAMIYKIATLYTDQAEDRKDLTQDIYIQIWKSLESFKSKSNVSTWLYRVALNTSIQYLKKKSRRAKHVDLKDVNIPVYDTDPKHQDPAIQRLIRSIQQLNKLDRAIILLYLEEKSHTEIAEIIGISVSNVGTRINRIKIKLNKLYQS